MLWFAGDPLKDKFQLCTQTDTHTQINLIACWTATLAVKNIQGHTFEKRPHRPTDNPSSRGPIGPKNEKNCMLFGMCHYDSIIDF